MTGEKTEFNHQEAKGKICMHIFKKGNVICLKREEKTLPVINGIYPPKKESAGNLSKRVGSIS